MSELIINSAYPSHTLRMGEAIGRTARPGDVFLLCGELGVGKTKLTQGIARGLDIDGYVRSPTFALISIHYGRLPLYHCDLYRLELAEEAIDIGLEEYLVADGISVIEWADKAIEIFQEPYLLINITQTGRRKRTIKLESRGSRYDDFLGTIEGEFQHTKKTHPK